MNPVHNSATSKLARRVRARKSISVTNEVRVQLYHQAQYNQCVTIIDLRALSMQQHAELPCRGNKAPVPPPTLLKAAYRTIISTLEDERGQRFDADYVRGQVNYQKANAALYRYEIDSGSDPDLRAFAQQTLPKIQDHLERALKLERELK